MKRARAAVILFTLGVAALCFSVGAVLHFSFNRVGAGTLLEPVYTKRYEYLRPEGDGRLVMHEGQGQEFAVQARAFEKSGGSVVGTENSASLRPVFSTTQMQSIYNGNAVGAGTSTADGKQVNGATVIMLDNDDDTHNNYVFFELTRLYDVTGYAAYYNGRVFNGSRVNGQIVSSGSANSFTNLGEGGDVAGFVSDVGVDGVSGNLGKIAFNNAYTLQGMFYDEGFYEFEFDVYVQGVYARSPRKLKFSFYIIHADKYKNMPVFELDPVTGIPCGAHSGIMRPAAHVLDEDTGLPLHAEPTNFDRFYYNFQGDYPMISFTKDRFSVDVEITDYNQLSGDVQSKIAGENKSFVFEKIGNYQIVSNIIYTYYYTVGGSVQSYEVVASVYAPHTYYLDIFGFQAYFENHETGTQDWFGGKRDERDGQIKNSDISNLWDEEGDEFNFATDAGLDATTMEEADNAIAHLTDMIDSYGIEPAVTNMSPVYLRYNVPHAFADEDKTQILSRVAFRQSAREQWEDKPYVIGRPIDAAGEYAIILYYKYQSAGAPDYIYRQIFYFRIDNVCEELMLAVYPGGDIHAVPETLTFTEFMGQAVYKTGAFCVYKSGDDWYQKIGPYKMLPRIMMSYQPFGGARGDSVSYNPSVAVPVMSDGIYVFEIYYGNALKSHMDFTVVLDNSPIDDFVCESTGQKYDTGVENLSVFGAGEVSISWGYKESGVGMKDAVVDFYEFYDTGVPVVDGFSSDLNYIKSRFVMESKNTRGLRIHNSGSGYRIADRFSATGLYVITVTDLANNKNVYVVVVDAATASFAQFDSELGVPSVDPNKPNVQAVDTTVYFGRYKLVTAVDAVQYGELVAKVGSKGGLLSDSGVAIPIVSVERSLDARSYTAIKTGADTHMYDAIARTQEGTYFYKIVDATGNVSTHYVQINQDKSQGIILDDSVAAIWSKSGSEYSLSHTATMVMNEGISNRDYLTFSFIQSKVQNHVKTIKIAYYQMNFQKYMLDESGNRVLDTMGNPVLNDNYPFSSSPEIFVIDVDKEYEDAEDRLFIDINRGPKTKQGMYVISRIYDEDTTDDAVRNYYFIVDNNPIISAVNFESDISIEFGAKTAEWKDFQKQNNAHMMPGVDRVLSSNNEAVVKLPSDIKSPSATSGANVGTKYGNGTFNILGGDFSAEAVSKVFGSLKLGWAVEYCKPVTALDESGKALTVYDFSPWVDSEGNTRALDVSGMYRISFTDGSGGYSWMIGGAGDELFEGNRSEVLVELFIEGPQGAFYLNGTKVESSSWQSTSSTVMSSVHIDDKNADKLTFVFTNDDANFMQPINLSALVRKNGDDLNLRPSINSSMEYTRREEQIGSVQFVEFTLPLFGANLSNSRENFTVQLWTTNAPVRSLIYEITLDSIAPNYNLNRITTTADGDKWYYDNSSLVHDTAGGVLGEADNPLRYPFRISNNFVFRRASGNPYYDTFRISYFEVDNTFANISGECVFDYAPNSASQGDKTFYEIVGMKETQNRIFRIVEIDEAGNKTEYFVELRGDGYRDKIEVSRLVNSFGNLQNGSLINYSGGKYQPARGCEIVIQSVHEFYKNNLFFEMSLGDTTIRRFGSVLYINQAYMASSAGEFASRLQTLVDSTIESAQILTFNNRFEQYSFTLMQISSSTRRVEFDVPNVSNIEDTLIDVFVSLNLDTLPEGLRGMNFEWVVYDMQVSMTVPLHIYSGVREVGLDANHEYLFVVTDEFGRVTKIEYNGVYENYLYITYSDSSLVLNGQLYVGDASGVSLVYTPEIYDLLIYKDNVLVNGSLPTNVRIDQHVLTTVTVTPDLGDTSSWKLVAVSKGTGEAKVYEWNFYTKIPVPSFTNPSGQALEHLLDGDDRTTAGVVTVSYSNEGLLFGASISYTRTYANPLVPGEYLTDRVTVGKYTTKFNLTFAGYYVFEIVNELWAKVTYSFEITDVDNMSFKVYFRPQATRDFEEIKASPIAYSFNDMRVGGVGRINIPNYFVVASETQLSLKLDSELSLLGVTASINNPRLILGEGDVENAYFDYVPADSTYIYRLVAPLTGSEIFFAVTHVNADTRGAYNERLRVSAFGFTDNFTTDGRYQIYSARAAANGYIDVYVEKGYQGTFAGNLICVDYYRNGEFCGTLIGTQGLRINARDYGIYSFYVRDWAGNKRIFEHTMSGVSYQAEYFTVINLMSAPLLINGSSIIDGMAYNDQIDLSVMDIPYDTMTTNYAFINKLSVTRNGVAVVLDEANNCYYKFPAEDKSKTTVADKKAFTFYEPGYYKFVCEYKITVGGSVFNVKSVHDAVLVSSSVGVQDFHYSAPTNSEIVSVRFNGNDIRKSFDEKVLSNISLGGLGNGNYHIVLRVESDNIYQTERTREFTVVIRALPSISVVRSNVEFGSSTTDRVEIRINPLQIYSVYGESSLSIMRGSEVVDVFNIGMNGDISLTNDEYPIVSYKTAGKYQVYVTTAAGEVFFAEGFEIKTPINSGGIIVLIILAIAVIIALIVFMKLRTNLRVK